MWVVSLELLAVWNPCTGLEEACVSGSRVLPVTGCQKSASSSCLCDRSTASEHAIQARLSAVTLNRTHVSNEWASVAAFCVMCPVLCRYLMCLQELRVLWLADNPCTKLPHYRAFVVAHLPNLEELDNVPVK